MTDIIACLVCDQELRVPVDRGDLSVRCPKCGCAWDWSPKDTGLVRKTTGLIVQADDLEVGKFYGVHGQKNTFDAFECPAQNAGLAFKILAMNLPFVVGKFICNPACCPCGSEGRIGNRQDAIRSTSSVERTVKCRRWGVFV